MSKEVVYKYIVYTRFNMKDNIFYPCMCGTLLNGKLLKDSYKLVDLYGIVDSTYSYFEMESMTIRRENILYIAEGEYTIDALSSLKPIEKELDDEDSDDDDLNNQEDGE